MLCNPPASPYCWSNPICGGEMPRFSSLNTLQTTHILKCNITHMVARNDIHQRWRILIYIIVWNSRISHVFHDKRRLGTSVEIRTFRVNLHLNLCPRSRALFFFRHILTYVLQNPYRCFRVASKGLVLPSPHKPKGPLSNHHILPHSKATPCPFISFITLILQLIMYHLPHPTQTP